MWQVVAVRRQQDSANCHQHCNKAAERTEGGGEASDGAAGPLVQPRGLTWKQFGTGPTPTGPDWICSSYVCLPISDKYCWKYISFTTRVLIQIKALKVKSRLADARRGEYNP